MENADTGYHQHSHRRSNYSRSNELHVEKAAKKKRKAARKRRQKIKALKEAKASSKHKDAFSLFLRALSIYRKFQSGFSMG